MTDFSLVADEWTHGCDALLQNITLWIPRCPHCGKPAPTNATAPQPQAEPVAWRVFKFTGSWKCADERWEVYSPDGSGGAVNESDVLDENVRALLDAMAATPQPRPQASAEDVELVGRYVTAHKSLKTDLHDAWQRIRASLGVGRE